MGRVESINVSNGGVPKNPVESAYVRRGGLEGDRQDDLSVHGGPNRAVSLYALERIETFKAAGHPIFPGAIGENLTISGLEWEKLHPGQYLRIGNGEDAVELRIESYAAPCQKIAPYFADGRSVHVSQKVNPGQSRLYASVAKEGRITVGDLVQPL